MRYTVTKTRYETVAYPRHEHIEGVCTDGNQHYTRINVVQSIRAGNTWVTWDGRNSAVIKPIPQCPHTGCTAGPYITTAPDHTQANNLENLPRC